MEIDIHLSNKQSVRKQKNRYCGCEFQCLKAKGLCASVPSPNLLCTNVKLIECVHENYYLAALFCLIKSN